LQGIALILPRWILLPLARLLGLIAWHALPRERKRVLEHLTLAFGDQKTWVEKKRIGRGVFENLGQTAVDTLRIPLFKKPLEKNRLIKIEPLVIEKLKEAHQAGHGTICLASHIGNWELISLSVVEAGFAGTVIGRRIYYEPFNRVIEAIRHQAGVDVLYRDQSPKDFLKVLKANEVLCFLADQDVDSIDGIFVPFFG